MMNYATTMRRWKTEDEFTHEEARLYRRAVQRAVVAPRFETDAWREAAEAAHADRAARRDAAQRVLDEAQREIAAGMIDGTDARPAQKAVAAAREELEGLDHVDEELARRDAEDHDQYTCSAARAALTRTYEWYIVFLAAVESVLEARAALIDAEQALTAVGINRKAWRAQHDPITESDIDRELLAFVPLGQGGIPEPRIGKTHVLKAHADTGFLTVEGCRELRAKAETLAAVEAGCGPS